MGVPYYFQIYHRGVGLLYQFYHLDSCHLKLPFMKILAILGMILLFNSCNDQTAEVQRLQSQVDSLRSQLDSTYKPGFGEFMSEIQVHHEKLWFAGINQNWKLADFEINEIKESLGGIKSYCTDRPESKYLGMIDPPMDSLAAAIQTKDLPKFKAGFTVLTQTCNSCHQEVNHGFNVIQIPETPPFTDQVFKISH